MKTPFKQKGFRSPAAPRQRGVMLLEALIGLLIFSLGILAMIAMQARAVQLTTDAKLRFDAAYLANQLIAQMWVADKTNAVLVANFTTGNPEYNRWLPSVTTNLPGIPAVAPAPTVVIDAANNVTVTINWRSPSDNRVHSYTAVATVTE